MNVNVVDGSSSVTMSQQITYDFTNTPTVTSVTPSTLSVMGGESVTIVGANFPSTLSSSLRIGGKVAQILSQTTTQIVLVSPALSAGTYSLVIPCSASIGYAR